MLARQARALGARRQLELIALALCELRRRRRSGVLGQLEQRRPRPVGELVAQRRGRVELRGLAQRRSVAEGERRSPLAVAEREPRARLRLLGCDPARRELGREPGDARRLEAHELAARGDGLEHIGGPRGDQDQVDELGRLLERLEQPVGGRVAERLCSLDREHAPAGLERRPRRRDDDGLVDVGDEHLRSAARGDPA